MIRIPGLVELRPGGSTVTGWELNTALSCVTAQLCSGAGGDSISAANTANNNNTACHSEDNNNM